MNRSSLISAASGAVLATFLVSACGPKKDPDTAANQGAGGGAWGTPPPQGGYGNAPAQGGAGNAPATTTVGAGAAPATTTAPPPATTTAPPPATTTAPPVDASALAVLLTPLQQKHAPGAKPDGAPIAGMIQPGTPLTTSITLQPSGTKCYTAIAVGAPPVTDLLVEIWASPPPPLPPMPVLMAQSTTTGIPAVLAGAPNCFKNLLPVPVPATLKVTARAGGGPVLAQLYAKLRRAEALTRSG
jgi:hypothetical protein